MAEQTGKLNRVIAQRLYLAQGAFKILFQKENTEGVEAWQKTAGQEKNEEND